MKVARLKTFETPKKVNGTRMMATPKKTALAVMASLSPFFTSSGSMGSICFASRKSTISLPVGMGASGSGAEVGWSELDVGPAFSLSSFAGGVLPFCEGGVLGIVCAVGVAMPWILLLRSMWRGSVLEYLAGKR